MGAQLGETVFGIALVAGGIGFFLVYRDPYRNALTRWWYSYLTRTTRGISADTYLLIGFGVLVVVGLSLVFGWH